MVGRGSGVRGTGVSQTQEAGGVGASQGAEAWSRQGGRSRQAFALASCALEGATKHEVACEPVLRLYQGVVLVFFLNFHLPFCDVLECWNARCNVLRMLRNEKGFL
jgi:hypothetical protein